MGNNDRDKHYVDILCNVCIDVATLNVDRHQEYMKVSTNDLTVGFVKYLLKKHAFAVIHDALKVISPREFANLSKFKSEFTKVLNCKKNY